MLLHCNLPDSTEPVTTSMRTRSTAARQRECSFEKHVHCMVAISSVFCVGCGTDLHDKVGDRRLLTSHASQHIIPMWKEILSKKLCKTGITVDFEAMCSPGYICRKCFRAYDRFKRDKTALLDSIEAAFAHMPLTSTPVSSSRKRVWVDLQECDEQAVERANASKRSRLSDASPAVQVHWWWLQYKFYVLMDT